MQHDPAGDTDFELFYLLARLDIEGLGLTADVAQCPYASESAAVRIDTQFVELDELGFTVGYLLRIAHDTVFCTTTEGLFKRRVRNRRVLG